MEIKICIDCGRQVLLQKHCVRCKTCQIEYRNTKSAELKDKYRRENSRESLGTTDFYPHKRNNIKDELSDILKEFKKLGLRRYNDSTKTASKQEI